MIREWYAFFANPGNCLAPTLGLFFLIFFDVVDLCLGRIQYRVQKTDEWRSRTDLFFRGNVFFHRRFGFRPANRPGQYRRVVWASRRETGSADNLYLRSVRHSLVFDQDLLMR